MNEEMYDLESIGRFLTNFATLEFHSYGILRLLPDDELSRHGLTIHQFQPRVRFVQALLRSTDWEEKLHLHNLLDSALELASFRNKLVHNPIMINFYEDPDTKKIRGVPVIANPKKPEKNIDIAPKEMEAKQKEAYAIVVDISRIVSKRHQAKQQEEID